MIFPGLTADGEFVDQQVVSVYHLFFAESPDVCCAGLLIIPTCQHSKMDLVQTGEAAEEEKDSLLEKVMSS